MRRRHFLALAVGTTAILARPARLPAGTASLRTNFFESFPPLSFRRANGPMTGILIDTLDEILGRRLGLALTHIGLPWARAQESVRAGMADALCTVPTESRRSYCNFSTETVLTSTVHVFYGINNPRRPELSYIRSLDDLKSFSQGDYIGNGFAELAFKGLTIEWSPRLETVLAKLASGRNDVFVGNMVVAKYLIRRLGLEKDLTSHPIDIGNTAVFHLGIRKTYPDAASILARYDAELRKAKAEGLIDSIIARYTGDRD